MNTLFITYLLSLYFLNKLLQHTYQEKILLSFEHFFLIFVRVKKLYMLTPPHHVPRHITRNIIFHCFIDTKLFTVAECSKKEDLN